MMARLFSIKTFRFLGQFHVAVIVAESVGLYTSQRFESQVQIKPT